MFCAVRDVRPTWSAAGEGRAGGIAASDASAVYAARRARGAGHRTLATLGSGRGAEGAARRQLYEAALRKRRPRGPARARPGSWLRQEATGRACPSHAQWPTCKPTDATQPGARLPPPARARLRIPALSNIAFKGSRAVSGLTHRRWAIALIGRPNVLRRTDLRSACIMGARGWADSW